MFGQLVDVALISKCQVIHFSVNLFLTFSVKHHCLSATVGVINKILISGVGIGVYSVDLARFLP